jgi:hypothetical protein
MLSLGKRLGWTFSQTVETFQSIQTFQTFKTFQSIQTFQTIQKCNMSMFESRRRRDVVKRQKLKYEKRILTLDPDHAKELTSKANFSLELFFAKQNKKKCITLKDL